MSFRAITFSLFTTVLTVGAAQAATLANGSFDGPLAAGAVPTGWTALTGTPDTNDVNTAVNGAFSYGVQPNNSPDGGTWVGFGNYVELNNYETFGQTISDFVVGQDYTLAWDAVNTSYAGSLASLFNNANGIAVWLDNTLVGTGGLLAVSSEWTNQSITFTATSTEHLLSFRMSENVTAHLNIDGVSLTAAAPIPLPAGLPLVLSGIGALAWVRRRARG